MKTLKTAFILLSILTLVSSCVEITKENTESVSTPFSHANHSLSANEYIVSDIVSSVKMVSFIDNDINKKITHDDITGDLNKGNLLELFNTEQDFDKLEEYEDYIIRFEDEDYGNLLSSSLITLQSDRTTLDLFSYKLNGNEYLMCAIEVITNSQTNNLNFMIGSRSESKVLIYEDEFEKGTFYILLEENDCNRLFIDRHDSILFYSKNVYLGFSNNTDSFLAKKNNKTWKLYTNEDELYENHLPSRTYCVNSGAEIGRWVCKDFDRDITFDDF